MDENVFRVEVESLRQGKFVLEVDEPPGSLDLDVVDFQFDQRLTGRLTYSLSGNDMLVRGALRSHAVGECVRCLEPAGVDVQAPVDLVFIHGNPDDGARFSEEEIDIVDYYTGEFIDPSAQLRDLVLLELPTLPLCDETCRGLCPRCGANLNRERCACRAPTDLVRSENESWKDQLRGLKLKGT